MITIAIFVVVALRKTRIEYYYDDDDDGDDGYDLFYDDYYV